MLIDIGWLILGTVWLAEYYIDCPIGNPKEAMIGKLLINYINFMNLNQYKIINRYNCL